MHIVVVNTQETVEKHYRMHFYFEYFNQIVSHCIFCGLHTYNGKFKTFPIYAGMILPI